MALSKNGMALKDVKVVNLTVKTLTLTQLAIHKKRSFARRA